MRICLLIRGALPPELSGNGPSMWQSQRASLRAARLRRAAADAMEGRGPFTGRVSLTLTAAVGRAIGDADHWLSGCMNALAAAPRTARLADLWNDPSRGDIHPSLPIVLLNDKQVRRVAVTLMEDDLGPTDVWYQLAVEQL